MPCWCKFISFIFWMNACNVMVDFFRNNNTRNFKKGGFHFICEIVSCWGYKICNFFKMDFLKNPYLYLVMIKEIYDCSKILIFAR